jgi:hypothetical protein
VFQKDAKLVIFRNALVSVDASKYRSRFQYETPDKTLDNAGLVSMPTCGKL